MRDHSKIHIGILLGYVLVSQMYPERYVSENMDPAGAATPQIAPPTRAPAGRRPTDARHSRH